ncbi:hypothetical protein [uncultured Eubacterium sp.]|uniref:hypothetical protein n=1 Tax=uncultured Eubacterium sp. TaxID=165185 RepID=UPI0025FE44EA|nr:hypothetical protein [uncultured Eubacterium sp.]
MKKGKMFKKSISCLLAALMIIASMPFTAITAFAATGTLSNSGFTIVYNNSNNNSNTRWENNQFNIVNDQQYDNTSVGILKYNISALKGKTIDSATLNFSVDSFYGDGNGLVFYYSNRLSNVTLNNGSTGDSKLSYGEGTTANTGAASRYGFDINNVLTTVSRGDTASKSVDIASAVKSVLSSGSTEFYVFIMQKTAGGSGSNQITGATAGWTDAKIKPANVTINYSTSVKTSYTFDEMVTALNNFTPYSPNAHGSFSNDTTYTNYSDHYKGLVYAEDVRDYSATGLVELSSGYTGSNTNYANLYFPTSVALYTGSNEITVPIMISAATARSGFYDCYFRPHAGVISGTGLSLVNSTWNGKTEVDGGRENCYANGNQTSNLPGLDFMKTINLTSYYLSTTVATSPTNSNIDPGYGRRAQIFANKVKVSPSFNDNAKSTVLTYNPTVTYYVTPKDNNINTGKYITFNSTDAVTVVNYKPYLDKINTAKQDIRNMNNIGSAHYEAESLKAYVDACVKLINIDPSDNSKYAYSSAAPNAAQTLANDINSALTAYDNAKADLKFNYTFIDVNNNSTVVAAKNASDAYANKPTNTVSNSKPLNEKQHTKYTYTWPTSPSDYVFTEKKEEVTENHDFRTLDTCTCGAKVDVESFEAAKKEADVVLTQSSLYENTSYKNFSKTVTDAGSKRSKGELLCQADFDNATFEILYAKTKLKQLTGTVTLTVYDQNNQVITDETKSYNVDYGTEITIAPKTVQNVYKYVIEKDGTTSEIYGQPSISYVVTGNAAVKAYCNKAQSADEKYTKVTFLVGGKISDIKYVKEGETLDTSTANKLQFPFFTTGDWDQTSVQGSAEVSSVTVRAELTPVDSDKCGVYIPGKDGTYTAYQKKYDEKVDVKDYGLDDLSDYALSKSSDPNKIDDIIAYMHGTVFYAPARKDVYVIPVEKGESSKHTKVNTVGTFTSVDDKNKYVGFNCKFSLAEGCTPVEWGITFIPMNANYRPVDENGNPTTSTVFRIKTHSKENEYAATLSLSKNSTKYSAIRAKAYLKYKDADNNIQVTYGDEYVQAFGTSNKFGITQ